MIKIFFKCFCICFFLLAFVCLLMICPFPSWVVNLCPDIFSSSRMFIDKADFWIPTWISIISLFVSLLTALIANRISNFSFQTSFSMYIKSKDIKFEKVYKISEIDKLIKKIKRRCSFKNWIDRKKHKDFYKLSLEISGINTQMLNYIVEEITIEQMSQTLVFREVYSELVREVHNNSTEELLNVYFVATDKNPKHNSVLINLISPQKYRTVNEKNIHISLKFVVKTYNSAYKQDMKLVLNLCKDSNNNFNISEYYIIIE